MLFFASTVNIGIMLIYEKEPPNWFELATYVIGGASFVFIFLQALLIIFIMVKICNMDPTEEESEMLDENFISVKPGS